MKLIHEGGYSRDERESFKEIIFSNTVQSMRVILEAMESLELPLRINAWSTMCKPSLCNLLKLREKFFLPKSVVPSRRCGRIVEFKTASSALGNINSTIQQDSRSSLC